MDIRKKLLSINGLGAVGILVVGLIAITRFIDVGNAWSDHQADVGKKTNYVIDLRTAMGYGGAIHNFKNYVLRGDEKYIQLFHDNRQKIVSLTKAYRDVGNISSEEEQALREIDEMADSYSHAILGAKNMWEEGKTSDEAITKLALIKSLLAEMGYGGAIHSFKNYVLRGDAKYHYQFQERRSAILNTIDSYRALGNVGPRETESLDLIAEMINKYSEAINISKDMRTEGKTSDEVISKMNLTSSLLVEMGYGGAIHNFKNYILRGDPKYLAKFQEKRRRILKTIASYKALENTSKKEKEALRLFEEMVNKYDKAIIQSRRLWARGKPSSEVLAKIEHLDVIRSEMGYGGVTHSFNNYVLRGGDFYLEKFDKKKQKILAAVKAYRKDGILNAAEKKSLLLIEDMIAKYSIAIRQVKALKTSGATIDQIEKQVQVNDEPYLDAMTVLSRVFKESINARKDIDARIKINDTPYLEAFSTLSGVFRSASQAGKNIDTLIKINDKPYLEAFSNLDAIFSLATVARKDIDAHIEIDDTPYFAALDALSSELKKATDKQTATLVGVISTARLLIMVVGLLAIFAVIFAGTKLTLDISQQISSILSGVKKITQGDLSTPIPVISQDELGTLTTMINEMQTTLAERQEALKRESAKLEEQDWIKTAFADITGKLQSLKDMESLGETLLTSLCPMIEAALGIVYVKQVDRDSVSFKLAASYAYTERKTVSNQFKIGEGLVGQCGLEKKKIQLTEIPDDYLRIQSGLGEGTPKNIIVLPIMHNENILGILELGSLKDFSPIQIMLLDQISDSIGVLIDNITSRIQTENLLAQARELAHLEAMRGKTLTEITQEAKEQSSKPNDDQGVDGVSNPGDAHLT